MTKQEEQEAADRVYDLGQQVLLFLEEKGHKPTAEACLGLMHAAASTAVAFVVDRGLDRSQLEDVRYELVAQFHEDFDQGLLLMRAKGNDSFRD